MEASNDVIFIKVHYANENQPNKVVNCRQLKLSAMYNLAGYINIDHCIGVRSLVDDSFYNFNNSAISKETSILNDGYPIILVYIKVPANRETTVIGLHNLGKAKYVNILQLLYYNS